MNLPHDAHNYILHLLDKEYERLEQKQKDLIEDVITWDTRDTLFDLKKQADQNKLCRELFIKEVKTNNSETKSNIFYTGLNFDNPHKLYTPTSLTEEICQTCDIPKRINNTTNPLFSGLNSLISNILRKHRPAGQKHKQITFPVHLFEEEINSPEIIHRINKTIERYNTKERK